MLNLLIATIITLDFIMDSHQGFNREYVLTLLENRDDASRHASESVIIVMNPHEYVVNISASVPLNLHLLNTKSSVEPRGYTSIPLNTIQFYLLGSGINSKGISVMADADVLVFVRNKIATSDDIYYVHSTSNLGDNYVAITNCQHGSSCEIAVVGVRNNTRIDFTFPTSMEVPVTYEDTSFGPGDTLNMTLDAYETFQLQSLGDLSGVTINASFPILSLAGSTLTAFDYTGRDHIGDTLLPTCYMGTQYVIATRRSVGKKEHLKIVTLYDDTQVHVTGINISGSSVRLYSETIKEKYQVVQLQLSCTLCRIEADRPVTASHFPANQDTGDPGMYIAVPVEHFRSRYFMPVPYESGAFCEMSIIISTNWDSTGGIFVNNKPVSDSLIWKIDHEGGFKVTWIDITEKNYTIEINHSSDKPFGGHIVCTKTYLVTAVPFVSISQGSCKDMHYVTSTSQATTEVTTDETTLDPATTTASEYRNDNDSTTEGAMDNVNLLHHTTTISASLTQSDLTTVTLPDTTAEGAKDNVSLLHHTTTISAPLTQSDLTTVTLPDTTTEGAKDNVSLLHHTTTISAPLTQSDLTTVTLPDTTTEGAKDNVSLLHHTTTISAPLTQSDLTTVPLPDTTDNNCTHDANSIEFTTATVTLNSTSTNQHCYLVCDSKIMTNEELQNNIKELKKQLSIDKKKTTVAIYKKISAGDDRASSKFIGTVAIFILVLVFGSLVLMDMGRVIIFLKHCNRKEETLL